MHCPTSSVSLLLLLLLTCCQNFTFNYSLFLCRGYQRIEEDEVSIQTEPGKEAEEGVTSSLKKEKQIQEEEAELKKD